MKAAVVIPTYRREKILIETLEQVLANSNRHFEVVVVDQTPVHESQTQKALSRLAKEGVIEWIHEDVPSLTRARNRAAVETDADVLVYLDDDVLLAKGWFEAHLRHYGDPLVFAVVGLVHQRTGDVLDIDGEQPGKGTEPSFSFSCPREVSFLAGGNFSVRRSAIITAGGFDEAFVGPANFEENDFAKRLINMGGKIIADPDAWVIHLKYSTGGCRIPGNESFPEWTKSYNYLLYALRHGTREGNIQDVLRQALRVGPLREENRRLGRMGQAWWGLLGGLSRAIMAAPRRPKSSWPEVFGKQ